MKTEFQKTLPKDTETLWAIVKIYHPDIPEQAKEKMVAYAGNYDWVSISFNVKGYGRVDIGIDNCCQYKLYGDSVSKSDMAEALKDGTVRFRTWRFSLDKLFDNNIPRSKEYDDLQVELNNRAVHVLQNAGYKLQSAEEMYQLYYED